MKPSFRAGALFVMIALAALPLLASTRIVHRWVLTGLPMPEVHKMLIASIADNYLIRQEFEDEMKKLLAKYGRDDEATWSSITTSKGSVQHLDFLTQHEKDVYKTAFELDQRWIVEHAADRTPFICQSQSINLFLPANVNKRDLHQIHFLAWKRGVKSLYYCRSLSIQRAETVAGEALTAAPLGDHALSVPGLDAPSVPIGTPPAPAQPNDYEECLSCQ